MQIRVLPARCERLAGGRIGIGDPEAGENAHLERFHRLGLVVRFVIVAQKMQETVHH